LRQLAYTRALHREFRCTSINGVCSESPAPNGLRPPTPTISESPAPRFTSAELAQEWRPYVETCIDAFGPDRCMFESNFPPDSAVGSYRVVWNAFKRLVVGASDEEKAALFGRTAIRTYRLDLA